VTDTLHQHDDDDLADGLDPALLSAWEPEVAPSAGFADSAVDLWSAERVASVESVESVPEPEVEAPAVGGFAASVVAAAAASAPEPVADITEGPASWWASTAIVAIAAAVVAAIGLTLVEGTNDARQVQTPSVTAGTSSGADAEAGTAAEEEAAEDAGEQTGKLAQLQREKEEAERELAKLELQKERLEAELKRVRNLKVVAAQKEPTGPTHAAASKMQADGRVNLGDRGYITQAPGAKVVVRRKERNQVLVVNQAKGVADYELAGTQTVLVVTPSGSLTVRGKSFTVTVPPAGEGEVTIRPKAGQAVVATASGKQTLEQGEQIAVARRANEVAKRAVKKPARKKKRKRPAKRKKRKASMRSMFF